MTSFFPYSRRHRHQVACGLLALAGCISASAQEHPPSVGSKIKALEQSLSARTPIRSGILVQSPSPAGVRPVGQPFTVDIDFSNVVAADATVSFTSDDGLKIRQAAPRALPIGTSRVSLNVSASTAGLRYINVFTKQNGDGGAISIPVQVGPATAPPVSRGIQSGQDDSTVQWRSLFKTTR